MATSDGSAGLLIFGVGDVGPLQDPADNGIAAFQELVAPTFAEADVRIGQCERLYSVRGTPQAALGEQSHSLRPPEKAALFRDCGFDVVSLGSNHAVDFGTEALVDTLELFHEFGIATIGAGRTIGEAREPVIVERNGVTVAILGYCAVGREGYEATETRPGVAPIRAHTYYEPVEYQAGTPPRVVTVPYAEDLEAMVADIVAAKAGADAVVLVNHWGVHMVPRVIADYQEAYALAAFAAGADLIIGHHAHVPKAVAVYGGKACFYSVGNFIVSGTRRLAAVSAKRYGARLDDVRKACIARARVTKEGVRDVGFTPMLIDDVDRPEPLTPGDPRFDEALEFMEWVSEGFPHRFTTAADGTVAVTADPDFAASRPVPVLMQVPQVG